ncbi:hypothetical protein L9F63_027618, partial [Diploptera punctata]
NYSSSAGSFKDTVAAISKFKKEPHYLKLHDDWGTGIHFIYYRLPLSLGNRFL